MIERDGKTITLFVFLMCFLRGKGGDGASQSESGRSDNVSPMFFFCTWRP